MRARRISGCLGRFKQNKMAMVGLIFLAFMILMCILVPVSLLIRMTVRI
ncbi:MAG: hypothetical protein ACLVJ6_06885 [Merdibacter sp.]